MKYNKQVRLKQNSILYNDDEDCIRFHWDILTLCNYNCSYCYRRNEEGWGVIPNKNLIYNTINNLDLFKRSFEMVILGGEPTKLPYLDDVLLKIYEKSHCRCLGIITNNSKDVKCYLNTFIKMKDKFVYQATLHPEHLYNKDVSLFFNNIKTLKENNIMYNINVMLSHQNFESFLIKCLDIIKENNFCFNYNIIFDKKDLFKYANNTNNYKSFVKRIQNYLTPEKFMRYSNENEFIDVDDIDTYISLELSYFKGWNCRNNNIQINVSTGKLIRFCDDLNINFEDLDNFNFNMVCPLDGCTCQGKLTGLKYVK